MTQPEVVGFSPDLAVKIADLVRQTQGEQVSVPSGGVAHMAIFGRVSVAASSGSVSTPTTGKFKPRDIGLAGDVSNLSTEEIEFVNPHEGVEFLVDEDIVLVDTGQSWIPVVPSANQANGVGHGTLPSAIDTTDATVTVNLAATSPLDPSTTITATNWAEIAADAGAKAVVQKTGTTWTLIQISC